MAVVVKVKSVLFRTIRNGVVKRSGEKDKGRSVLGHR